MICFNSSFYKRGLPGRCALGQPGLNSSTLARWGLLLTSTAHGWPKAEIRPEERSSETRPSPKRDQLFSRPSPQVSRNRTLPQPWERSRWLPLPDTASPRLTRWVPSPSSLASDRDRTHRQPGCSSTSPSALRTALAVTLEAAPGHSCALKAINTTNTSSRRIKWHFDS